MPEPSISIVIAVRNAASTIQRSLDSVFEQTYPHVEVIVIDGASDDGTTAVLERSASKLAYWVSEPDRSVYDAWNKALDHAHGDWIMFLGADDRLSDPAVLRRAAPTLAGASPAIRVVYGRIDVMDAGGAVRYTLGRPWQEARREFENRMSIPHPGTFHRRELFDLRGRFDDTFRIAGDYEFLLRELPDNDAQFVPDLTVACMAAGGLSHRPDNKVKMAREVFRAREMHGLASGPEWLSPQIIRARGFTLIARTFGTGVAETLAASYRFVMRRDVR